MPAVPHLDRPICEPVSLRPGARLRVRRVSDGAAAVANAPFPHYHDVAELVLFGRVRGEVVVDGTRFPLAPGCATFVPSLQQHDFALRAGARDWTLVQLDPGLVAAVTAGPGGDALRATFCARPTGALAARIATLGEWLNEVGEEDPAAPAIAELLLHAAVRSPRLRGHGEGGGADALRRLRPAIEALRRDPAHAPSAQSAAALCALSPAYFSRRFRRQLGMAWSEYVRTHRLHLASQLLLDGERSAAAIAAELGFATASHFGELFRRRFGLTPDAYRHAARR